MTIAVLSSQDVSFDRDILSRIKQESLEYIAPEGDIKRPLFTESKTYIFEDTIIPFKVFSFKPELTEIQQFLLTEALKKLDFVIDNDDPVLEEEDLELPNENVINLTSQVINELALSSIFPHKISTTIEEGICLVFKKKFQNLFFEIYNDGGIGYIIEDSKQKKILENRDLYSFEDILSKIKDFVTT